MDAAALEPGLAVTKLTIFEEVVGRILIGKETVSTHWEGCGCVDGQLNIT